MYIHVHIIIGWTGREAAFEKCNSQGQEKKITESTQTGTHTQPHTYMYSGSHLILMSYRLIEYPAFYHEIQNHFLYLPIHLTSVNVIPYPAYCHKIWVRNCSFTA